MPRRYPAEFRRRVLDLIAEGRPVAEVAADLGISAQVIYTWRKQDQIDRGESSGLTSTDRAELVAARRRIAQLEASSVTCASLAALAFSTPALPAAAAACAPAASAARMVRLGPGALALPVSRTNLAAQSATKPAEADRQGAPTS
jgi:transposase